MGAIIGFPSPPLRPWAAFRGCRLLRLAQKGGGGLAPPRCQLEVGRPLAAQFLQLITRHSWLRDQGRPERGKAGPAKQQQTRVLVARPWAVETVALLQASRWVPGSGAVRAGGAGVPVWGHCPCCVSGPDTIMTSRSLP